MKTTNLGELLPPAGMAELEALLHRKPVPPIADIKAITKKYAAELLKKECDADYLAYAILGSLSVRSH